MPRQNTRLESEGAEFLVLGQLLIQGIPSYKTYTNMAGYDLVATNPESNSSARLQIKSRWKTGAEGFIIKNFDCNFVILVKLNRGSKDGSAPVRPPEYYVIPANVAKALPRSSKWNKISFSDIPNLASYQDNWTLIREFLVKKK